MNLITRTWTVVGLTAVAVTANATITPIGQFSGAWSETFESFNNYQQGPFYQPEPMVVMGGNASFDSVTDQLAVFEPSFGATFGIGGSGVAQPSDGVKGLGLDTILSSWTLTFGSDTNDFGAFWGAFTNTSGPTTVFVDFFDSSNVLVGSTTFDYDHQNTGDGILDWNGWNSDVAFRSVRVAADYLVVDGMQATNAVPEPATMSVLALGALAMLRRRKSVK